MSDNLKGRRLLVCNCEKTMDLDGGKLSEALGLSDSLNVNTQLCRRQLDNYRAAVQSGEPVMVACTQEAPLFGEVAEEMGAAEPAYVNIREQAGWSEAGASALPKMAALITEAAYQPNPTGLTTLKSEGVCLVYGAGQQALDVARQLSSRLSVTLVLKDASDAIPPAQVDVPIYRGTIAGTTGTLGGFEVTFNGHAPMKPSSRDEFAFEAPQDNVRSECDLILDVSGDTPLFTPGQRRDGYFRADPNQPGAVARAMFEITDMVGEFEKPIYVSYNADICAHSRSGKVGCTNCLDVCPTGAITPDGDHVSIDPAICGGCGQCNAVCPTGAASYAYPHREDLIGRAQTLLKAYASAGGRDPVVLVHDATDGRELVSAMSRFGRGLPANVLPFALHSVAMLGHDLICAMVASGAGRVVVLASPKQAEELEALHAQAELAQTFMRELGYGEDARVEVLVEADPDAVESTLHDTPAPTPVTAQPFLPIGSKRDIARLAISKLREGAGSDAELIALPESAPYGRVNVDTDACTLCLACVSACPASALLDGEDTLQLRFIEQNCVQCGICKSTCPESAITLEPRYNFRQEAANPIVLNEDEPFACVRCGKPFGSKKAIDGIIAKLEGKHWMFESNKQTELLKMCDNCRIVAMAESSNDPFKMGEVPRTRTTEDYIMERDDSDKD
ncbi:4Fe-4S binding protein [Dichotomicrobium thermohalophilum]|nr:4Fe-4S binding protein [Dichotomicrobium thermohalophilum]